MKKLEGKKVAIGLGLLVVVVGLAVAVFLKFV